MTTATTAVRRWDGRDLRELLALESVGEQRFVTCSVDPNDLGNAYGGQVLAQALTAATRTVDPQRSCTAMQMMFLQGTRVGPPVELEVSPLQDGKRFSARHVRGRQAGRIVIDGQVSFSTRFEGPFHQVAPTVPLTDPEQLPRISELPREWAQAVERAVGYLMRDKPTFDYRIVDPAPFLQLSESAPAMRYWIRFAQRLPDDAQLHAAAFTYLSDWWVNYPAVGAHQAASIANDGLHVASLNHSIWFHQDVRADEWLHFESVSPACGHGRGMNVARVHDRQGRLVATVTQECLAAF